MIRKIVQRCYSNSATKFPALGSYHLGHTDVTRPVGIFWDVDNVRPAAPVVKDHILALRTLAQRIGVLDAFTAFGNASTLSRGPRLFCALRTQGVSCVRTTIIRNAADDRLIAAARSFIAERGAGACLIIVSGDQDLLPLAVESRERGVAVVTATLHRAPARRLADFSDIIFFTRTNAAAALSPLGATLLRGYFSMADKVRNAEAAEDGNRSRGIARARGEARSANLSDGEAEDRCLNTDDDGLEDENEDDDEDEDEDEDDEEDRKDEDEDEDENEDDEEESQEEPLPPPPTARPSGNSPSACNSRVIRLQQRAAPTPRGPQLEPVAEAKST
jgi:hypothetical protein